MHDMRTHVMVNNYARTTHQSYIHGLCGVTYLLRVGVHPRRLLDNNSHHKYNNK